MKLFFRKNFKLTGKKEVSFSNNNDCKEKCKKWDRNIAFIFALIAFSTLVGIVLYNIFKPENDNNGSAKLLMRNLKTTRNYAVAACKFNNCEVKCDKIYEDKEERSIAEEIEKAVANSNTCMTISLLKITKSNFQNYELNHGWLKNLSLDVTEILFAGCELKTLNNKALSGRPFTQLKALKFTDTYVESFTKDALLNLTSVLKFEFQVWNGGHRLHIGENALEGMKVSLRSLQFQGCIFESDDIINLTGNRGANLKSLRILDFRTTSIQEIKDLSFINASDIEELHLSESKIQNIQSKAFSGNFKLLHLDLSKNALETLPEGIFDELINIKSEGLVLYSNQWKCDCSLAWLKDYYDNTSLLSKKEPLLCYSGCNIGVPICNISDATFCPNTIPTTSKNTETTISSSTTLRTTTESTSKFLKILCKHIKPTVSKNVKSDVISETKIEIKDEIVSLEIHELDTNPLLVQIRTVKDLSGYHLIWFNANDKSEYGCVSPIEINQTVEGLNRGTTYTFTLLEKEQQTVSPKSNFCLKTEPEWLFRTWIHNEYRSTVVAGLVCTLLLLLCVTVYITFICIRRHPRLISSNKDVIIIKAKQDTQSEPHIKEYEGPAYCEPYLVPSSHGYLTPKYHRYSKVRYRPPLMRSLSEWSVSSSNLQSAYADPAQLQGIRFKLNRNGMSNIDSYNEYRPPLPPPNPGCDRPRISQETQEESIYSAI